MLRLVRHDTLRVTQEEWSTRWTNDILATPSRNPLTLRTVVDGLRQLISEHRGDPAFCNIIDVENNAMSLLCHAIKAGAFSGNEWLVWRTRLADNPHITHAAIFLHRYGPGHKVDANEPSMNAATFQMPKINPAVAASQVIADAIESFLSPNDPGEATPAEPCLSLRQQEILQSLCEQKAFTSDSRMTITEVAERCEAEVKSDTFKRPVAALKAMGLVASREGRGGGIWLTPESGSVLIWPEIQQ